MLTLIGKLFGDGDQSTQSFDASARQQEAAEKDDRYRKLGFKRAVKHEGEPEGFQKEASSLAHNRIFPEYEPSPGKKQRLKNDVSNLDAKIQQAEEGNEVLREDIEQRKKKQDETRKEIEDLRAKGGYETNLDPVFWMLSVLCGGLALLLALFFSAAAYTALFSNFAAEVQQTIAAGGDVLPVVTRSVFDPQAFRKAWQEGFGTFLLVILVPLVFLGSGALLHRVLRERTGRQWKTWAAILVSGIFLVDAVLAYRITSMVYEVRFLAGLEQNPWRPWFIFADVHFYLVFICGFIPHLIWAGLLYVLHTMWVEGSPIRRRERQLRRWRQANERDQERIRANKENIRDWRASVRQKKKKMEGDIIPASAVVGAVEAFTSGWNGFISASGDRVEERTKKVNSMSESFLDDLRSRLAIDEPNE
jgi:hypothetical protein